MLFDAEFPTCREGLFTPPGFATPEQIVDLTVLAEDLGYHAVWGTDFVAPMPDYGIPEDEKPNWYEPLTTIAYAAARTKHIKLGTGLLLAPLREPVIMAKQVATIDQLSQGRMLLGLGLGMSRNEFTALKPHLAKARRGDMLDECIELLCAFFEDGGPVDFDGEYYAVRGVELHPKPVQDPFPIYVPCRNETAYKRIVRWGLNFTAPASLVPGHVEALRPMLEANGRDPNEMDAVAEGEVLFGATTDEAIDRYQRSRHGQFRLSRQGLDTFLDQNWVGTVDEITNKLGALSERGVDHFYILHIPVDDIGERRELLHQFAEEVIPALQ